MDELESGLRELSRRAFEAYDDGLVDRLSLVPLAVCTFTGQHNRNKRRLRHLVKRFFEDLAKQAGLHLYVFNGSEPECTRSLHSGGKHPHFHCVICIKRDELQQALTLNHNKPNKLPILKRLLGLHDDNNKWLLEACWRYGRCEFATPRKNGRPVGYAVHKHTSSETGHILSIHCPKLAECQKRTKKSRVQCKVKREFWKTTNAVPGLTEFK